MPFDAEPTDWIGEPDVLLRARSPAVPLPDAHRVARHRATAARCTVPGCAQVSAGYEIIRGWGKLCAGHVAVRWRYISAKRQRFYLRRYKRRLREASAAERAARRAMIRKLDGTEGRRRRRATISRSEADARKRELCAGSERQREPWLDHGVSESTYRRAKRAGRLHELQAKRDTVTAGSADSSCLYTAQHTPTAPPDRVETVESGTGRAAPSFEQMPSVPMRADIAASFILAPPLPPRSALRRWKSPHRFAGGPMQVGGMCNANTGRTP